MPASKSSANSLRSEWRSQSFWLAFVLLSLLGAAAVRFCFERGYITYYGDAEAHLNIARRILDSRTPGPEQIGTVWLPLPHLAILPFAMRDAWWRNGLAGAIPSVMAYVLAGVFLFAAARRAYRSEPAALAVVLPFALNPNILYLASTPMTEPLFLAALAALLWATLWFRDSQSAAAALAAAAASLAASLTRYEGWFLIPFVTVYLFLVAKRKWHAALFSLLAALGPAAWLAHNQFYYSNALEFYNGPYSAKAIYQRQLAGGMLPYPGDHDWRKAAEYYAAAAKAVCGAVLLGLGAAGAAAALLKRVFWPLALLALPPAFYIWSMHSSGTPVFVPDLYPFSWYNTRYAVAVVPLAAFAAGALIGWLPKRARFAGALAAGLATISVASICWKESQVNSEARRAWTREAAAALSAYQTGAGILYSFGDLTGVLREAGIPLREGLHEGNHPAWDATIARPDLFLREEWALAFAGDPVATAIQKAERHGRHYALVKQILVKGAPVVEIYRLNR